MWSTIAQLRLNILAITVDVLSDANVTTFIGESAKCIKTDLGKIIDFDLVPDTDTASTFINLLSQYKTCELCLVNVHGAKRNIEEISDRIYWENRYNKLIGQIKDGEIALELDDGTSISGETQFTFSDTSRSGINPAFGEGDYGEFENDDDLAEDRPLDE